MALLGKKKKKTLLHIVFFFIVPFLISTEVEAPLARAFASYESSHLRWNIHTLPQAFFFFSFIQTELYITATFALRACASELLFVKWNKKKKRGTEKRRSLRPHPRGRSDRLSVTRVCQQWRLRRGVAGCRVTVRLVPIQFVKFKTHLTVRTLAGPAFLLKHW